MIAELLPNLNVMVKNRNIYIYIFKVSANVPIIKKEKKIIADSIV